jgi:uncharacterized membrane protein
MMDLLSEYRTQIVFLHVFSAVVWVGGMIAMRYAAHQSLMHLSPPERLERTAHALKRLFAIVAPFTLILLVTALIMAIGMGLHKSELKTLAFAKEGIWSVMLLNYLAMVLRRNSAQKMIIHGDLVGAKAKLELIGKFMVPVNILLGIIAIYLGVTFSHAL